MARGTGVFNERRCVRIAYSQRTQCGQARRHGRHLEAMILAYEAASTSRTERIDPRPGPRRPPRPPRSWYKSADTWTLGGHGRDRHLRQRGSAASWTQTLLTSIARGRWLDDQLITIAMLRQQGLTAAQTADHLGIGLSTYRRIEHDAMLPSAAAPQDTRASGRGARRTRTYAEILR